eukprot:gb/GFBE01046870.1/.p1 GENE.gb/GFBE01046870.1/~~gb/GFBE01046870.1/.p1  ORF type:complete len:547 (+),score=91.89 gb/GFBE01046870.1/:1-1641(+)
MWNHAILLLIVAVQTTAYRPSDVSHDERLVDFITGDMGADVDETCDQCVGNLMDYNDWLQTTEKPDAAVLALTALVLGLIWFMVDTTQCFFTPALFYWTARLKLSPEMAAATLLAIGNGAPDSADAIVSTQKKDVPLGLSNLAGSALFSICCTSGACLLNLFLRRSQRPKSDEVLSSSMYLELICFYIVAVLVVIAVLRRAEIKLLEALALPLLYGVYLARVAWTSRGRFDMVQERRMSRADEAAGGSRGDARERHSSVENCLDDALWFLSPPEDPADRTLLKFLVRTLTLPFYVARLITIPPSDQRWDHSRRVAFSLCPTGLFFLCLGLGHFHLLSLEHVTIVGVVALCWSALLYFTGNTGDLLPWYYTPMTIFSIVSCVLWLGAISTELTSILESLGRYFHVSRMRFGFTVLAWGSSMQDAISCFTLVSLGHSAMAFNGILASQFFDITVGFGTALIAVSAQASHGDVLLFWRGWPATISMPLVACALASLAAIGVLVTFVFTDPHADKPFWAPVLTLIYVSFLVYMWFHTEHDVAQQIGAQSS